MEGLGQTMKNVVENNGDQNLRRMLAGLSINTGKNRDTATSTPVSMSNEQISGVAIPIIQNGGSSNLVVTSSGIVNANAPEERTAGTKRKA